MEDEERLKQLQDLRDGLEQTIQSIDFEIERAEHALVHSKEPGRLTAFVSERYQAQQSLFYDLGKAEAKIEALEARIQERADRGHETEARNLPDPTIPVQEDHLDWLRPALNAEISDHGQAEHQHHYEGERAMLDEMHNEDREPDDYLDWYQR